jgi:hypothetical protein
MVEHHRRRALEKGDQMRYKAIFIAGVAVGFVAGARAGRGAYDKMMDYGQQIAGHPKVQQATSAAQAKATELAKTAAAKAPDYAKSAANSAKQAATSKMPARFGGTSETSGTSGTSGATDPAADGTVTSAQDDVAPDGNLVYPADGGAPSVKGIRYTPDTP